MTHVKAREWIKRIPETRTDAIDAGCKGVLQEIWDHVTWSIHRAPVGRERPWVSREEIADAIGSKPGTVADRIRKLTDAGWLRWDGRCWDLAWQEPFAVRHAIPGQVYAVAFSDGTVKVGRSADAEARIACHRAAAACFGLTVIGSVWSDVDDAVAAEAALISEVSAVAVVRSGAEWFDGGYAQAAEWLDGVVGR